MEAHSKLTHDPLFSTTRIFLPHTLLSKRLHLTLTQCLRFFPLFLLSFVEVLFILHKWTPIFHLLPLSCFLLSFILIHLNYSKPPSVYLVDFSCLRPPNFCRVPFSCFLEHASMIDCFDADSTAFMAKILHSSGQSESTYLPPSLHYIPPCTRHADAMQEVRMVLFPVMDDLLSKTKVSPLDIDILIVNCSGFCPTPSISSIIINKYSMRPDIKSFNISGMGCSAGTLSIDLAHQLLKLHKNSYALVLSTEILSTGWYAGKERAKLLINCLFRMGSAAVLLTNRREGMKWSKYKLFQTLRTQRTFDDKGYYSAIMEEDANGLTGVHLNRDLLQVAGETLRANVTVLGSSILPFTERFRHGVSVFQRRFLDKSREVYVPNFKSVVQHFCLPASGKPVIREIAKGLRLTEGDMEPALMTLHRFGNQSSSSMWYELAYMEAKQRVKIGDKVWQLGMGSGPKCNSVIWECLRHIRDESEKGPWADTIDGYPIVVGFDKEL